MLISYLDIFFGEMSIQVPGSGLCFIYFFFFKLGCFIVVVIEFQEFLTF